MHPGGVSGPDVIFAQYADDPPYKEKVGPLIAKFGGRYLVRAGELTTMGDDWKPERIVILEFADKKTAMAFFASEEYAPVAKIRERCATTNGFRVEGI